MSVPRDADRDPPKGGVALVGAAAETTMLLVEQNLPLAMDLADRFYVLDNGQVVEEGDTSEVGADDERLRRHLSA